MKPEHVEAFSQLFETIYQGNADATKLSFDLLNIAHTWDDLIDKDKEITDDAINKAFLDSLYTVQLNPLYGLDIASSVLNCFLRWQDANAIEKDPRSTHNDLAMAWMLRAGLFDIFVLLATKLYGLSWAKEIGVAVRKAYGEKLNDFILEIENA